MLCKSRCLFSQSSSCNTKRLVTILRSDMTYDLLLEVPNSVLYLDDLLHQPVCRLIPAELDVGPLVPVGEPRLGHLGRGVLVPDGVLEVPDHALNLRDLVNSFLEVCLQFPEDKLVSVQG